MRRLRSALAILATVLGMLVATGPAASAGTTGYHFQEGYACAGLCTGLTVFVDLHTTNTAAQIWINGTVSCTPYGGLHDTWCGVGGGNGTDTLDTGANFTWAGISYWFRLDLHADGSCTERGNAPVMAATYCFALRERTTGIEPAAPTLARSCSTN